MTQKEKAHILAWRRENVPIKGICWLTGFAKSRVMALLALAHSLFANVIFPCKTIFWLATQEYQIDRQPVERNYQEPMSHGCRSKGKPCSSAERCIHSLPVVLPSDRMYEETKGCFHQEVCFLDHIRLAEGNVV